MVTVVVQTRVVDSHSGESFGIGDYVAIDATINGNIERAIVVAVTKSFVHVAFSVAGHIEDRKINLRGH